LQLLVLTLLPASSPELTEAGDPDPSGLAEALRDAHPALATAQVRFAPADTGAAAHLAACMDELHQGQWDAVLFGGVDSLTDHQTVRGLAARDCCRTDRHPEGTLPGEGAAYILLEKPDKDHPPMALITGSGQALEEHHGKAADRPMTGLAAAIEQALDQGQCPPARVESIVLPMGNDVPAALEWHQVRRRLWADPEEGHREMEELAPQSTIGETGAAALPLALAIGCARFEFDFPPVDRMLVCEAGRGAPRGAVLIERKPSAATPSPATKGETP
jgi:3-oxoacyl-[acyl-carrier-protein] synthase-1